MKVGSGSLLLRNATLVFDSAHESGWQLPVASIVVVGELTNSDGPHWPDYFLVLIDRAGHQFFCPFDADGAPSVFTQLCDVLGCRPQASLVGHTRHASLVHWPHCLQGADLFQLVETKRNWLARLLLGPEYDLRLSAAVTDIIGCDSRSCP
jgi:hypothetical protein